MRTCDGHISRGDEVDVLHGHGRISVPGVWYCVAITRSRLLLAIVLRCHLPPHHYHHPPPPPPLFFGLLQRTPPRQLTQLQLVVVIVIVKRSSFINVYQQYHRYFALSWAGLKCFEQT